MSTLASKIRKYEPSDNQVGVFYCGQEGFIFVHGGIRIAIDPYFTDYVDKNCCQLVEWRRAYDSPILPAEADFLDFVVLTHTHYDHSDPWTIDGILKVNGKVRFVVPAAEMSVYLSYGVPEERLILARADESLLLGGVSVTPVPSAHEQLHTDENGDYRELGYIFDFGVGRFFHAGDMCMYDGLKERLQDIDLGFLPINGRDYFRNANDIIGNFSCEEAVTLAKEVGIGMLVPMHHDLYAVNGVSTVAFVDALERLDKGRRFHIFAVGEKLAFER